MCKYRLLTARVCQDSTVRLGYKRNGEGLNLEQSDLWVLQEHLRVETMNRKFLEMWEEEKKRPKPSIRRALWRLIRSTCLASSIFELIRLVGSFANPLIVREIIVFIQQPTMDFTYGITLAFSLCIGAIAVAFGKSHSFHFVMNAGAMVKGAINAAAFDKSLRLSNSARQRKTVGQIVNIMSADADKLYQNFFSFNSSWSAPLQLGVALYLLYQQVKDATWVGLASLLFSFVVLAVIFVRIAILERLRLKFSDVRVKLMNEMVQGIKIIKFMGWEGPILEEIERAREGELPYVRKIAYTKALMISFVLGTSIVVSIHLFGHLGAHGTSSHVAPSAASAAGEAPSRKTLNLACQTFMMMMMMMMMMMILVSLAFPFSVISSPNWLSFAAHVCMSKRVRARIRDCQHVAPRA
jgi:ATP-binding cassette subfamily C (CFTR/MRP) protein 1